MRQEEVKHTSDVLEGKRQQVREIYNRLAAEREQWIKRNRYYYNQLKKILRFIVRARSSVLQVGCATGHIPGCR